MEIIMALGRPTINEFARFVNISPPNAAYKVNSLIQKGYVRKEQSPEDKAGVSPHRDPEVHRLLQHQLWLSDHGDGAHQAPLPRRGCKRLEEMLRIISSELMPEISPRRVPCP